MVSDIICINYFIAYSLSYTSRCNFTTGVDNGVDFDDTIDVIVGETIDDTVDVNLIKPWMFEEITDAIVGETIDETVEHSCNTYCT